MSRPTAQSEIERFLCERAARLIDVPVEEVHATDHLIDDLFLDSLKATQLAGQLADFLGMEVDPSQFYEVGTIEGIARQVGAAALAATKASAPLREISVHISATFTAEPSGELLGHWLLELGCQPRITFAPYNQVFQELLDPRSALHGHRGGVNVLLVRIEDWFHDDRAALQPAAASRVVDEFLAALRVALSRSSELVLLALCPRSPLDVADRSLELAETLAMLDARLLDQAGAMRGVHLVDARGLENRYRIHESFDRASEAMGHIPFHSDYYAALGTELARAIHAHHQAPAKVVVLDCDNSLWRGVCGEDGATGVFVDAEHEALQRFMVGQCEMGKLLCLCSKNDEADVWAVFEAHPGMPLRREHIAAWRINWQPKSANIEELAVELNLATGSFVFVDDNPVECAEVAANAPTVLVLPLPSELATGGADIERFLSHHWAFDVARVTDDDRERARRYRENRQREGLLAEMNGTAGGFAAFIEQLELKVAIAKLADSDLERASQLTERTNQFNATTRRCSAADLAALIGSPAWDCFAVRVGDRFGDHGFVGLLVTHCEANLLVVDTLLLSCRVLGRTVEDEMVRFVSRLAVEHVCDRVSFPFRPTARNRPVMDFYLGWGAALISPSPTTEPGGFVIEATPVEIVEALARREAPAQGSTGLVANEATDSARGETETPGFLFSHSSRAAVLQSIAARRGDAAGLLSDARARRHARPNIQTAFVAPRSHWQGTIAALWCDVLRLDRVGIHDSFFDLGGDSLAAAELFARLRSAGAPESVSLGSVPTPTVARLAEAIEDSREGRSLESSAPAMSLLDEARSAEAISYPAWPSNLLDPVDAPQTLFVTGASGYFGAYLLRELMARGAARVFCHVRARSPEEGMRRIEKNLARYDLWNPAFAARLTAIPGDLAQPLLGMSEAHFTQVAAEADAVFHNGAWVNFILPYSVLAPTNVRGTETILRLVATGKPKALHFISTLGVLMSSGHDRTRIVREDDVLDHVHAEDLPNGYEQSKWVADKMVAQAMTRGLRGTIYRLGMLSGLSDSGTYHKTSEFLPSFLKGCLQLGSFPDLDTRVEMVPVDFVARATAVIAAEPKNLGRVYHMNHPHALNAGAIVKAIQELGYPLRTLPWDVWKRELMGSGARLRDNALYPFIHFIAALKVEQTFMPEMDLTNYLGAIQAAGATSARSGSLDCPSQEQLLERYFRFFNASGFIAAPA